MTPETGEKVETAVAFSAFLGGFGCVMFVIALPSITMLLLALGLLRYLGVL